MSQALNDAVHWADLTADKLIRQEDKETYTLASGITPSGVVHFGNFREVMTTELVARGLKKRGKRFVLSFLGMTTIHSEKFRQSSKARRTCEIFISTYR